MIMLIRLFLSLLSLIHTITAYSQGPPDTKCGDMTPSHYADPQPASTSPYTILVDKNAVGAGQVVGVTLTGSKKFKGFLVEVVNSGDGLTVDQKPILGSFTILPESEAVSKYLKCNDILFYEGVGSLQGAVVHNSGQEKGEVKLEWRSPSTFNGKVKVVATFVENFSTYWVKQTSDTLQIGETNATDSEPEAEAESEPEAEAESEPGAEPKSEPVAEPKSEPVAEPKSEPGVEPESEPGPEPEPETSGLKNDPIYAECGESKTCFGAPAKCTEKQSCNLLATWKKSQSGFEFELRTTKGSGQYVALGFSQDSAMGDELVIVCAQGSEELRWNSGKSPPSKLGKDSTMNIEYAEKDGIVTCKINSGTSLASGDKSVDLTSSLVPLIAGGDVSGSSLGYHNSEKLAGAEPLLLADVVSVGTKSNLFYQLHGMFMLIAWIGCAGAGMTIARYFKQTWVGQTVMGQATWFQAHRILMIFTVVFSILGVVLLLIQTGVTPLAWDQVQNNAHPATGLATVLLALLQPVMAAFRPHPGTSNRWIFNWAHWLVGNSAHLLAAVSLVLVPGLTKAGVGFQFSWIVVAYVAIHLLDHLILSLIMAKAEQEVKVKDTQMTEIGTGATRNNNFTPKQAVDQWGSGGRKIMLIIYLIVVWAFVIILSVAVFTSSESLLS